MRFLMFIVVMLVGFAIGALCWTYAINEWLIFFGKDIRIEWWQGGIIGFVPYIGKAGLVFAAFTWILMLFLI